MKTDKLLRVLSRGSQKAQGRLLPLPKAQKGLPKGRESIDENYDPSGLYYKDEKGVLRFKSNNMPVATGAVGIPLLDPIDIATAIGAAFMKAPMLAGNFIHLPKAYPKSAVVNQAWANFIAPLLVNAGMGGDDPVLPSEKPEKRAGGPLPMAKRGELPKHQDFGPVGPQAARISVPPGYTGPSGYAESVTDVPGGILEGPPLKEVEITAPKPTGLLDFNEWLSTQPMGNWLMQQGYSKRDILANPGMAEKWQQAINTNYFDKLFQANPDLKTMLRGNRLKGLQELGPEQFDMLRNSQYGFLSEPGLGSMTLQGLASMDPLNIGYSLARSGSPFGTPMYNAPGLTREEAGNYNNPLSAFSALAIPSRIMQAGADQLLGTGEYGFSDALRGRPSGFGMQADMMMDPLLFAETFPTLFRSGLNAASKVRPFVSNEIVPHLLQSGIARKLINEESLRNLVVNNINLENLANYNAQFLGQGSFGPAYTFKKFPNLVLKASDADEVAQYFGKDLDFVGIPKYPNQIYPTYYKSAKQIFEGKPLTYEVMSRIPGKSIFSLTGKELESIPKEAFSELRDQINFLRQNDVGFDLAGDNLLYDPVAQRFGMIDLAPNASQAPNSAVSSHMFKDLSKVMDDPTAKMEIRNRLLDRFKYLFDEKQNDIVARELSNALKNDPNFINNAAQSMAWINNMPPAIKKQILLGHIKPNPFKYIPNVPIVDELNLQRNAVMQNLNTFNREGGSTTNKLLRVLTRHQGPNVSQVGPEEAPPELVKEYESLNEAINAILAKGNATQNTGKTPVQVKDYLMSTSIGDFLGNRRYKLDQSCKGPYCATAGSVAMYETYPESGIRPTTGGDNFRDMVLSNPAFGITSEDIYSKLSPGSLIQNQVLRSAYTDPVTKKLKYRSVPSYQSAHNYYVYDVKELENGRKRVYTVQNPGSGPQILKEYDIDKEGNLYRPDTDDIAQVSGRLKGQSRPTLMYYKGQDVWSNPELNELISKRQSIKDKILESNPKYFDIPVPTRFDTDYTPGAFMSKYSTSDQGPYVVNAEGNENINLSESRIPEILNQVNDPEYKKMIMKDYNISNDEYNAMIKTMMGQYMMESQGGTDYQSGLKLPENKLFSYFMPNSWVWNKSLGPFQMNYGSLSDKTRKLYPSDERDVLDFIYDPVKSSDIAMRFLAENVSQLRNRAKSGNKENLTQENYLDFLPYLINQQGWLARSDKSSREKKGSILGEGVNKYVQGVKYYGDQLVDYVPMNIDPVDIVESKKKEGGSKKTFKVRIKKSN